MKYTNKHNIDPVFAIWLTYNEYNNGKHLFPDKELVSATTLLKPTRKYVLEKKFYKYFSKDISELIPSKLGHAIHDSVEKAFKNIQNIPKHNLKQIFSKLNVNEDVVDNLVLNPDPNNIKPTDVPYYLEKRFFKEINNIIISGQVDLIIDGQLIDVKSTSTFTYKNQTKVEDYIMQGSIYRWLAPDIITEPTIKIAYLFTDWQKFKVKQEDNYPPLRVIVQEFDLLSLPEIEEFILNKLQEITDNSNKPEKDIIPCSEKDLLFSETVYKYYANPDKLVKATKNFNSLQDANNHLASKGKGIIVPFIGQPKACTFCDAFNFCRQRKEYYDEKPN